MPATLYDNRDLFLRPNEPDGYIDWQQHPSSMVDENGISTGKTPGETFADMFIAWVYDAWNTSTASENVTAVDSAKTWAQPWMP